MVTSAKKRATVCSLEDSQLECSSCVKRERESYLEGGNKEEGVIRR